MALADGGGLNLPTLIQRVRVGVDGLDDTKKEIEGFGSGLQSSLGSTGASLTKAITLPIVGGFAAFSFAGVKAADEVNKGLREVNTLFGLTGQAAEQNFGDLSRLIADLSKSVGIAQDVLVHGLYQAVSAGVPKDNAFEFMQVAAKASIAGVTDVETSVNGLTSIINAFGLNMADAQKVSDSMFSAVKGGKTTFRELSDSIFQIAPAAAASKVSLQEVNAAIATMTSSGVPTAVATSQLRAALVGLQRPSDDLTAIFKKAGFATAQAAIEEKGLAFSLGVVKKAANGNQGTLQNLLGSVEAVSAANIIAGTGAQKMGEQLDLQSKAAGATQGAFEEMNKSTSRQIDQLKVSFQNLSIQLGNALAPAVQSIVAEVSKAVAWFSTLDGDSQKLILTVGGIAAAMGPVLIVTSKLIGATREVVGVIGDVGGAVIDGGKALGHLVQGFSDSAAAASELTGKAGTAGGALRTLVTDIGNVPSKTVSIAADIKDDKIPAFITKVSQIPDKTVSIATDVKDKAIDALNAKIDSIKAAKDSVVNVIVQGKDAALKALQDVSDAASGIKSKAISVSVDAKEAVSSAKDTGSSIVKSLVSGIAGGVGAVVGAALTTVGTAALVAIAIAAAVVVAGAFAYVFRSEIADFFSKTLPSVVGDALGALPNLLTEVIPNVAGQMAGMVAAAVVSVMYAIPALIIAGIVNFGPTVVTTAAKLGLDIATGLVSGLITVGATVVSLLAAAGAGAVSAVAGWAASLIGIVASLPGQAVAALSSLPGLVLGILTTIVTEGPKLALQLVTEIVSFVAQLPVTLPSLAGQAASGFLGAITGLITSGPAIFVSMVEAIAAAIFGLPEFVLGIATGVVTSFVTGATTIIGSTIDIFGKVVAAIANTPFGAVVGKVTGAIVDGFHAGWDRVNQITGGLLNDGLGIVTDFLGRMVGAVASMPGKIATAAVGMFDGIKEAFKEAVNFIIRGWNNLHFSIPGFSVGPVHFGGFDLGVPQIPYLAKGGTAVEGGAVMVGEKGPEIMYMPKAASVVPLPRAGQGTAVRQAPWIQAQSIIGQQVIQGLSEEEVTRATVAGLDQAAVTWGIEAA